LIKDEIDHEKVDSSVVTSSGPSESSRADYGFIVIHTDSSSSESSKFPAMIQQVITSVFSFTGYLEFVPESSIPLLVGLDVCPRYPIYLFFLLVRVMPRVPTTLICLLHMISLDS